jgi:hypothetical protein
VQRTEGILGKHEFHVRLPYHNCLRKYSAAYPYKYDEDVESREEKNKKEKVSLNTIQNKKSFISL